MLKNKNVLALIAALASGICVSAPYPQYQQLVEKHATVQNLDKNLVWAVMGVESNGIRTAISNKNARGLMQVIPPTAARMGVNPNHLYDAEQNIIAGTRYLRFLSNRYKGDINLILAAYNAGEGAVDKYKGIPPYKETQSYVVKVRNRYARLNGSPAMAAMKTESSPKKKKNGIEQATLQHTSSQKTYAPWDVFQEF